MQFHNPEVLFALFLLIIPVIVHLFQLRKFRRESFTNVKFLRRLTTQTRKSSRIKKLLVLATRLLLLSCIIFAFARPYFPEENEIEGQVETVIFLDNSYRSEEHTSELQSRENLVCRLLLEKKKYNFNYSTISFMEMVNQLEGFLTQVFNWFELV